MKPRHGAISSTLLTLAGVLGLSAAGLSVVTGVTPCSLVSACDTGATAATAITVADTGECSTTATECSSETMAVTVADSDCKTACDKADNKAAKAVTVADSDCSTKSACEGEAKLVAASDSDCATKCSDEAKAVTVANSDCATKSACDGEAKAVAVSDSDCATKCSDAAKTVAVANSDCSTKSACDGEAKLVAASNISDCKTACEGDAAKAMTVADDSACGGECAEGDAVLPVALNAFNDNCPYSGNAANADVTADYNGMKVAFCCFGCKGRFEKADDDAKLQLVSKVVTPIDDTCCDKPVDASTMAVVQGFPVAFCKSACGEMVKNADAAKQRAFVASHIKTVNMDCCDIPAAEAKMVGVHHAKLVALCGDKCADHFKKASAEQKDAWMAKMVNHSGKSDCASECDDKAKGECGASCPHA